MLTSFVDLTASLQSAAAALDPITACGRSQASQRAGELVKFASIKVQG